MLSAKDTRWGLVLCFAVAIFSSAFFLFGLGDNAFKDFDEGVYATVIEEAIQSGDIFTFTRHGELWFEKPPLYIWSSLAAHKIFSSPEFAYRLPSALAGIISIVLVMLIAYEVTKNLYVGATAGAVLTVTPAFLEAARQVLLDVPVTVAVLLAAYCFLRGHTYSRWFVGVGIAIGIGILIKSVIALLAGIFILAWSVFYREYRWIKKSYVWIGVILGACIVAPWHIYEHLRYGAVFWDSYLNTHVVKRFLGDLLGGTSSNRSYFTYFLQTSLPWSVLLIPASMVAVWQRNAPTMKAALVMLFTAVSIFVLFLIADTKIAYYLVPAYPFVALFVALGGYALYESVSENRRKVLLAILGILTLLGAINTVFIGFRFSGPLALPWAIANDERAIGRALSSIENTEPVYTYAHPYQESLRYYSKGRVYDVMKEDQELTRPFYLVIPRPVLVSNPFPPELAAHFTLEYTGATTALLHFTP